jgi:PAS domain S-box-containing protein
MTIGQPGAVDSEPDLLEQLVPVDSLEQVENVGRFSAAVLDALPSHIAILAADGSIMAVNGAWERFAVENSGTDVGVGQDYLHVCDAAAARGDVVAAEAADLLRSVLSRRESVATLTYPCHSPSKQRWFLMRAAQLDVREGCAVVQHSEITEWMLADADAALKTRLLADVRSAVVVEDVDGLIAHWNDAATVVYGWSPEEVLGRTASDVLGRSPEWDAIRRAVEGGGGWSGLVRASRKNGSQVVVDIRCWTLRDADGLPGPVAWIAEDVTERVRKAEELRSARDLARAITESVPEGVFALDDGGRLTYMNVEAERLLGWSREELHGEPMHNVTHYQAASGAPLRREDCPITRTREAGEVVEVAEDTFVRRDGSLFPVAWSCFGTSRRRRPNESGGNAS